MKMKWKILLAVGAALLVLLVAFLLSVDSIGRTALEKGGTIALGTTTTLDSFDLSIMGGSADLSGLAVANPDGFPEGKVLELAHARAALAVSSLLSDTIEVREIILDAPRVKLVQKGLDTNLSVILATAQGASSPQAQETSSAKQFKIGLIRITDAQLEYNLGGASPVVIKLPEIELKDLASADGRPLMLAEVFRQVFLAMLKSAGSLPGNLIPENVQGMLNSVGFTGKESVDKTLQAAGDAVKDVGGLFDALKKEAPEPQSQ